MYTCIWRVNLWDMLLAACKRFATSCTSGRRADQQQQRQQEFRDSKMLLINLGYGSHVADALLRHFYQCQQL
jgi:hypothetical protein